MGDSSPKAFGEGIVPKHGDVIRYDETTETWIPWALDDAKGEISGEFTNYPLVWTGEDNDPTVTYANDFHFIQAHRNGNLVTMHFPEMALDITGGKSTFLVLPEDININGYAPGNTRYLGFPIMVQDTTDQLGVAWVNANDGQIEILPATGTWGATSIIIYGFTIQFFADEVVEE